MKARFFIALALATSAAGAPDEQRPGRDRGYPVGKPSPVSGSWYFDESVRVGSFSHQDEIKGLFGGKPNWPRAASRPMPWPMAASEPDDRWSIGSERGLGVEQYLARQRVTGLIIGKDGVIHLERHQYERKPSNRFTSHSMAKSSTALAVGLAHAVGRIRSLDDRAEQYDDMLWPQ